MVAQWLTCVSEDRTLVRSPATAGKMSQSLIGLPVSGLRQPTGRARVVSKKGLLRKTRKKRTLRLSGTSARGLYFNIVEKLALLTCQVKRTYSNWDLIENIYNARV